MVVRRAGGVGGDAVCRADGVQEGHRQWPASAAWINFSRASVWMPCSVRASVWLPCCLNHKASVWLLCSVNHKTSVWLPCSVRADWASVWLPCHVRASVWLPCSVRASVWLPCSVNHKASVCLLCSANHGASVWLPCCAFSEGSIRPARGLKGRLAALAVDSANAAVGSLQTPVRGWMA